MVSLATKSGLAPNISDLDRDSTRWVIGRYKIQYSLHSLVFNGVLLSLPSAILNYFEWTMLSPFCAARCSYPLYLVCPPGFSPVASILDFKSPYQQVTDCPVSYSTFTKLDYGSWDWLTFTHLTHPLFSFAPNRRKRRNIWHQHLISVTACSSNST